MNIDRDLELCTVKNFPGNAYRKRFRAEHCQYLIPGMNIERDFELCTVKNLFWE